MNAEEKLNLLSTVQARFDKLQKDTKVLLSGGQSSKSSSFSSTVDSTKLIALDANTNNDDNALGNNTAKAVQKLNVQPMFEVKARNLMLKIIYHPEILSQNTNGEIVVNGKAEPKTNFVIIFKFLV